MRKNLSIRQLIINSFGFIGSNFALLFVLAFFSFAGTYIFNLLSVFNHKIIFVFYGLYIYFYYYLFISLYYSQKPLFTKEKLVDCFMKFLVILVFSLFVLIFVRLGFSFLRHMGRGLVTFPTLYTSLRHFYIFALHNPYTQIIVFLSTLGLLTFSFFIPSFAWISTINGKDNSIIEAYDNVRGNYLKTIMIFIILYGIIPLGISFIGLSGGRTLLSLFYALLTVFQLVFYLHLYDFFYDKQ